MGGTFPLWAQILGPGWSFHIPTVQWLGVGHERFDKNQVMNGYNGYIWLYMVVYYGYVDYICIINVQKPGWLMID